VPSATPPVEEFRRKLPLPDRINNPDVLAPLGPSSAEGNWRDRALCAQTGPALFFPEKEESPAEAKRVCGSCEVRAPCLEYALEHNEQFGVWGGLSELERRRLKRRVFNPS